MGGGLVVCFSLALHICFWVSLTSYLSQIFKMNKHDTPVSIEIIKKKMQLNYKFGFLFE